MADVLQFVSSADLIRIPYFPSVPREKYGIRIKSAHDADLKDNISHAVAAIKITMLHRVYLNMVTARLLTNCSNIGRNIHTNAKENITSTRAKRKAGYFLVAHSVY